MFQYQEKERSFPLWSETPRKTEDPELGNSICFPPYCFPSGILTVLSSKSRGPPQNWFSFLLPVNHLLSFQITSQKINTYLSIACKIQQKGSQTHVQKARRKACLFCVHLRGSVFNSLLFIFICLGLTIVLSCKCCWARVSTAVKRKQPRFYKSLNILAWRRKTPTCSFFLQT